MAKFKKILQSIAVFAFGIIFIFLAYKLYFKDGSVNLNEVYQLTGQVTSSYETTRRTAGRYARDMPIFAFTVDNYRKTLGAYRPSGNYNFLTRNIKIGDTIKVYFEESKLEGINIDVYQIEKNGRILLDYDTYKRNHRNLSYFILALGLIFFFISYQILKQKK